MMWSHMNGQIKITNTTSESCKYRYTREYRFQQNDGALIKYSRELIRLTTVVVAVGVTVIFKSIIILKDQ